MLTTNNKKNAKKMRESSETRINIEKKNSILFRSLPYTGSIFGK